MKLQCPCGRKVEHSIKNGILVYAHNDGTYCDVLNDFAHNVVKSFACDKLKQAVNDKDYYNFMVYCPTRQEDVIDMFLFSLQSMTAEELYKVFEFITSKSINETTKRFVYERMILKCGKVAADNIKVFDEFYNSSALLTIGLRAGEYKIRSIKHLASGNKDVRSQILSDISRNLLIDKMFKDRDLKDAIRMATSSQ